MAGRQTVKSKENIEEEQPQIGSDDELEILGD